MHKKPNQVHNQGLINRIIATIPFEICVKRLHKNKGPMTSQELGISTESTRLVKSVQSTARNGAVARVRDPPVGDPGCPCGPGPAGPRSHSKLAGCRCGPDWSGPTSVSTTTATGSPLGVPPLLATPKVRTREVNGTGVTFGPSATFRAAHPRRSAQTPPREPRKPPLPGPSGVRRPLTPEVGGGGSSW